MNQIDSLEVKKIENSPEKKQSKLKKELKKSKNEVLAKLVQELKKFWSTFSVNSGITAQYLELFSELPIQQSIELAEFEVKSARNQDSSLLICMKNIKLREESLKGLKLMNQYLAENTGWNKSQNVITECAEILHAHRMITLLVVENIMAWAGNVQILSGKSLEFIENDGNYLEKLKFDSDYLNNSEMAKAFQFSDNKSDPFLTSAAIYTTLTNDSMQKSYFLKGNQVSIPIPFVIMNRINNAQNYIYNRGLSSRFLIEIAQKIRVYKGNSDKKPKNFDNNLIEYLVLTDLLEEYILSSLNKICEHAGIDTIGRTILYRLLDFNIILKDLVKTEITEFKSLIKNNKKELEKKIEKNSRLSHSVKPTKAKIFQPYNLNNSKITVKKNSLIYERLNTNTSLFQTDESPMRSEKRTKSTIRSIKKQPDEGHSFKFLEKNFKSGENISKSINFVNPDSFLISKGEKSPSFLFNSPNRQKFSLVEERMFNTPKYNEKEKSISPVKKTVKLAPLSLEKKDLELSSAFDKIESPSVPEVGTPKVGMNQLIIIQGIFRNCLETLINEINLYKLAENCILDHASSIPNNKSILNQQKHIISVWKLQQEIYLTLFDEFLNKSWLKELANQVLEYSSTPRRSRLNSKEFLGSLQNARIEEPEDYISIIFTPKVHSPNTILSRIDSVSENTEKSSIYHGSPEPLFEPTPNKKSFKLLCDPIKSIQRDYLAYYSNLTETYKKSCLDEREIMNIASLAEDCTWMKYVEGANLLGWIGFCTEFVGDLRSVHVFHSTTINPSDSEEFIKSSLELFESLDFYLAVFEYSVILNAYLRIFKQSKHKITIEKTKVSVKLSDKVPSLYGISLSAVITTSEAQKVMVPFLEPNLAMVEYGSRSHLALHLFRVLNENHSLGSIPESPSHLRLQQELSDILEILNADKFNFVSLIYAGFTEWKKSQIDLKFNWVSFSHSPTTINEKKYLFTRFHKALISKNDHYSVYFVNTTNPLVTVAFISYPNITNELESEVRSQKTDVFWKVENLLHSAEEKKPLKGDLCVPCFGKKVLWDVGWVKGFATRSDNEKFLNSCEENFTWLTVFPNKILNSTFGPGKTLIKDEFIIAVIHKELENVIDAPLFVALIRENNWIRL